MIVIKAHWFSLTSSLDFNVGRTKYIDTEPGYILYNFIELPTAIDFLDGKSDR